MFFSFSSQLSIVLISSVLFLVIGFCLKSLKQVRKRYIHAILACMAIILVRLVFPIEFTFEKTLGIWHILPPIYRFFHSTLFQIHGTAVTVNLAVGVVWGIGILVSAGNLLLSYTRFMREVKQQSSICDGNAYNALQSILEEKARPAEIKLVSASFVNTPMLCGFRNPTIVVPDMELSKEDWTHILRHEVAHYHHKDLYIKLAAEFLCAVYWWNPVTYFVKDQINRVLELNVDAAATKDLSDLEKVAYLECLIRVAKEQGRPEHNRILAAFNGTSSSVMMQRFEFILPDETAVDSSKIDKLKQIILVAFFALLAFLSYAVVFEPCSYGSEVLDSVLTEDNAFIVSYQNGNYDVFYNQEYAWSISENENIDSYDLPIYQQLEETTYYENSHALFSFMRNIYGTAN